MKERAGLLLIVAIVWVANLVYSDSVTLNPTDDAELRFAAPDYNLAAFTASWLNDESYMVVKYDLSAIPSDAEITSASLVFYSYTANWPAVPTNFVPIAVYPNTSDWSELTVTWNTAPSYNSTAAQILDRFSNGVCFTGENTLAAGAGGWLVYDGLAGLVQDWIDGSMPNCGISLMTTETLSDGRRFQITTSNHPNSGLWPTLTVYYHRKLVNPVFQDHMVLQREMDVPVWGNAGASGVTVSVELDGQVVAEAVSDSSGDWVARIGSYPADGGQSHTLRVFTSEREMIFSDVVFGDVYLAAGQSNMNRSMSGGVLFYDQEIAAADYPLIRSATVNWVSSETEQSVQDFRLGWRQCSPETVPDFSAVGYFFARNVFQQTGVPVGLLVAAWGGQPIERFLAPEGLADVPELSGMLQDQEQGGIANLYDIYNGMVHPLIPYGIRGCIWYQGESDTDGASGLYNLEMQALIRGWRQKWGQGDFPFYYVQLANWSTSQEFPDVRFAQLRALSETNTGMAVTIDIGDSVDVHYYNKQDAGARLAQWPLARDFGMGNAFSGPLYYRSVQEGASIRVLFDYAESGLVIGRKDGTNAVETVDGPLENFEIAGADRIFSPADAVVDAGSVLVSSSAVEDPAYVRYCYSSYPSGSNKLYNAAGLPASPFRTDPFYSLHVINGSSSGTKLAPGTQIAVSADTPPAGKVFDRWIGAASAIDNPNSGNAAVTVPNHSLYLLATYRDTSDPVYTLTVSNGYGSGTSQVGSILNIEASSVTNCRFECWIGDTQYVADVQSASTTLRMPSGDVNVTATYHSVDTVGDGISDEWRAAFFGGDGTVTNSLSFANADPDNDGMNNLQEFMAGTDPLNTASVLRLNTPGVSAGGILLDFLSVMGRRYRLEETESLISASWMPVLYNIAGDGLRKNLVLEQSGGVSRFYRVNVNE